MHDSLLFNSRHAMLLPQIAGDAKQTLIALINGYLFTSLFKASIESLASENASRLDAMQRAEKNIGDLLDDLNRKYHRLRQSIMNLYLTGSHRFHLHQYYKQYQTNR